ncbi:MAG: NAD-dependent epimerase/dehydratase family protein [Candidatus Tectimicrobiota bacterium]
MLKGANVLVTGGTGFIGTNLILRLLEQGCRVRSTLHRRPAIIHQGVEYVQADLTREEDCRRAVEGMDFVFMCAANTSGAAVMEKTPLVHLTPNVLMNILMLEAAYAAQVKKFLFISSNTVYPVTDYPVKENDVTNEFFDKYFIVAWMKRFTEIVCEMYATKIKRPMQVVVVRPANVYGEYDDFEWETSHVIPALIRKVVERHQPLEVWGDGSDLKEFIYVQDFIDGMLLAMEKIESFEPINIATGQPCTVKDVLQMLLELDGYDDAKVVFDTSKPTMIPKRLIDVSKAKIQLGFQAKVDMKSGLERTIQWYRNTLQSK